MLEFPVQIRTMKALSLWQPWGSLVARGVKRHETRHWSTPYRGTIAIHAAKTMDLVGAPHDLCRSALDAMWPMNRPPVGVIVAIGELTACLETDDVEPFITRADRAAGNYGSGRFAWTLSDVRALRKPIAAVVVLTVAHLDHTPENCGEPGRRPNLKAWCQRCHNTYDAPQRQANRAARRAAA